MQGTHATTAACTCIQHTPHNTLHAHGDTPPPSPANMHGHLHATAWSSPRTIVVNCANHRGQSREPSWSVARTIVVTRANHRGHPRAMPSPSPLGTIVAIRANHRGHPREPSWSVARTIVVSRANHRGHPREGISVCDGMVHRGTMHGIAMLIC